MTEKEKKEKDEEKYETDRKIERLEMRVKNLEETLAIQQELIRKLMEPKDFPDFYPFSGF